MGLKATLLIVSLTAFYGYIGQMVPQQEIHPPQVVEVAQDLGVEEMVRIGKEIFEGRGTCTVCHTIGSTSGLLRFPDLEGVGARADGRVAGLDAVGYLTQALYEPNAFIAEGFNPGMPAADKPPVGLTDDEILTVVAFLQSLGGEPTVTMATRLRDAEAKDGETPSPAAIAPPAVAVAAGDGSGSSAGLENGKAIYHRTCYICHGDRAQGNEILNAPKLAGQEAWYLSRQLTNFRTGLRGGDPQDVFGAQMRPMAMVLGSDQEVSDVAAYLASLTAAGAGP